MAEFEYDPEKSESNRDRHGIDFAEAQKLWDGPHIIIPAKNIMEESRSAILGHIGKHVYMAVFTVRSGRFRVISCHRADKKWVKIYETSLKN